MSVSCPGCGGREARWCVRWEPPHLRHGEDKVHGGMLGVDAFQLHPLFEAVLHRRDTLGLGRHTHTHTHMNAHTHKHTHERTRTRTHIE